uniref:Ribonuclease H-like domain-containing protein n=1 Tax=Tanacetum cinerariifolium TaxID=118510 RepID=A0A6L2MRC5_TANCI|nr:ribonuclease H-like domain-containing protein [Tanacetum cinerariifolium]
MRFLMGLNDAYLNIKSNIIARDPLPDVDEAFNMVYREESHRGLHPETGSGLGNKVQPTTFVAKTNNFRSNEPRRSHNSSGGNSFGNSNGKVLPKGASFSYGSTSFDTKFTNDQMMKILSLINDNPSRNASANMACIRPIFFNGNVLFNLQFEKYFCAQTSSYMYNLTLGWILDSGAIQHLINSTKNMFNVSDISSLNLTMGHPNGTLAKNTAIGSLRLTANVVLFDVLVIPEYNDLNLVKTLGTGSEAAGLLGNPSDHVLSVLSSKIGLKYDKHVSPCDICHQAKQTREPFPLFAHKSLVVGDLVHLDLWGPYRVVSRDGFKLPSSVLSGASLTC